MKKYCDYFYTVKTVQTTDGPMYVWYIREKNGKQILSSLDDDGVFPTTYETKFEAESDCREAIQDHYT